MYPLVSIVVPVYNVERYIRKCLESLCNQTFNEIEILVVDDGSTDKSCEICDEIAEVDSRVRVFHLANGGVARARNYGIEKAIGKYIAFSDSDDIMANNFVESAVFLMDDKEYVSCAFETINEKNQKRKIDYMTSYGQEVSCIEYLKQMCNYQAGAYWGANWGKLYKADIIKMHNIKFESNVNFAEDFRFNLEYLKYVNKIALIHNPVYYYRIDTNGSLSKKSRNISVYWQEYFELYHRYKELYITHGIFEETQVKLSTFLVEMYVMVIRQGIYYENMRVKDITAICQKIERNQEVQKAASYHNEMVGRSRYYAKLLSHNKGIVIAIILSIIKRIRAWINI